MDAVKPIGAWYHPILYEVLLVSRVDCDGRQLCTMLMDKAIYNRMCDVIFTCLTSAPFLFWKELRIQQNVLVK